MLRELLTLFVNPSMAKQVLPKAKPEKIIHVRAGTAITTEIQHISMSPFFSTLMHIVELLVSLVVAYVILFIFKADDPMKVMILGLIVDALSKFLRESEVVPDLVNGS